MENRLPGDQDMILGGRFSAVSFKVYFEAMLSSG